MCDTCVPAQPHEHARAHQTQAWAAAGARCKGGKRCRYPWRREDLWRGTQLTWWQWHGPGGRPRPASALLFLQVHAPELRLSPEAHVIKRCPLPVMEKGQRKPYGPGRGSGGWQTAWALPGPPPPPASPPWPVATLVKVLDGGGISLWYHPLAPFKRTPGTQAGN